MLTGWNQALELAGMLGGGGGDGKGKPAFSLLSFLSSEGQLLRWKSQGLPSDKLSSENAIVILNAPQPPLIIDPSSQATGWLKTYLQAQEVPLECVTPHETRFANALELGVRFGKTVVLGEADSIAPMLVPLLRRDLSRQGPRFVVQVGQHGPSAPLGSARARLLRLLTARPVAPGGSAHTGQRPGHWAVSSAAASGARASRLQSR